MEFRSPSSPSNVHLHTPGLNLDGLHDFGEGVGVDMRDFGHGRDDLDPELATPQLQTSGMSSMPPTSIMTAANDDMFQAETGMDDEDDDDDEGGPKKRSKGGAAGGFTYSDKDGEAGRRKIRIEYINDKSRRHITFSKRKAGIMKKAYELSILTGTQILLLVVSETGLVYTFTTTKLQPLVQKSEGKNLIQSCLNAPDGYGPDGLPLGDRPYKSQERRARYPSAQIDRRRLCCPGTTSWRGGRVQRRSDRFSSVSRGRHAQQTQETLAVR